MFLTQYTFRKSHGWGKTIRIHPHSSLIKLLYALCKREGPSWLQNDPLLSTRYVAQLKEKTFNAYRNWFIKNCVTFAFSIVFAIWYILAFMPKLTEESQIGWKTKYCNSFVTLKCKADEAGNTNLIIPCTSRGWNFIWVRRAYNYDYKILSRWPESNIGLPFSSLEYASSFSWDHSLQIERIIMFAV